MEEAAELDNYLPLSFKTRSKQEYIAFRWDAFETNYTHGKYQFAFLAYHMLTMSFVHFNIWQIRQARRRTSREVERAKAVWIEFARKTGKPIPRPRNRPATYQVV